ncbi:hypothetical protein AJ79_08165 [Helicocarpus griseus UAMH5409]|uniref:Hydrophobin n=1 Tax=Helicocarpus griseus UAMH5409 TaxID=1447875 RepID=A0A2B7WVN7_9EURO|nr:hypothetical protein AJ79_08165 [Helicocarpus griseus UAMH5409]
MRLRSLPLLPLLLTSTLSPAGAVAARPEDKSKNTSPFYQPRFDSANPNPILLDTHNAKDILKALLAKREEGGQCKDDFNSCALLGAQEACCQPDAVCSRDDANNIACCPSGAACTGVLKGPEPTETNNQPSSSNFMFPQPGTATTTPPPTGTERGTTIPNAPYPFTIIPTTFPGQEACVSAYQGCQAQFSSCTASLGGRHGVTVGGGGQGITVPGSEPTGVNPRSVCESLSTMACHGLQVGYCTAFREGTGGAGRNGGNGLLYDIVVGFAVAVAGVVA